MSLEASLIISVYKSAQDLRCILYALSRQSFRNFEVIVSEDGESEEISKVLATQSYINESKVLHLTQTDSGFRKNRALNRAVSAAHSPYLIFIDGDCIPASRFVESHLRSASPKFLSAGRRVELGKKWSAAIRGNPKVLDSIDGNLRYLLAAPSLFLDNVKNYESGIRSSFLQQLSAKPYLNIVGCNFSCPRALIEKINGFDEAYNEPGIGEDTDIQWRLERVGVRARNVKFLVPLFHLYHPVAYDFSIRNQEIFYKRTASGNPVCERGIYPSSFHLASAKSHEKSEDNQIEAQRVSVDEQSALVNTHEKN